MSAPSPLEPEAPSSDRRWRSPSGAGTQGQGGPWPKGAGYGVINSSYRVEYCDVFGMIRAKGSRD
jgi:hypothetical protein